MAARYADPATEFTIIRLTDPQFSSVLPGSCNRFISARAVLYASDMAGDWQAFRMDLKNREARQLTEAEKLESSSLAFLPNDKGFWHFDGSRLLETALPNLKMRELYRTPEGFEKVPGVSYSDDGQTAAFVEKGVGRYRLRLLRLSQGTASTLLESPQALGDAQIRPRHSAIFYRDAGAPSLIQFDGQQNRRITLAEGETVQARWSDDGRALLYLNHPLDSRKLTNLREWTPETGADARIADTSQYLGFDANPDASVFAGASGSQASPYLLLLVRAGKRELPLAEHHASNTGMVAPVFTPNSQTVLFVSDQHGKPAIYSIAVDKIVESTGGS